MACSCGIVASTHGPSLFAGSNGAGGVAHTNEGQPLVSSAAPPAAPAARNARRPCPLAEGFERSVKEWRKPGLTSFFILFSQIANASERTIAPMVFDRPSMSVVPTGAERVQSCSTSVVLRTRELRRIAGTARSSRTRGWRGGTHWLHLVHAQRFGEERAAQTICWRTVPTTGKSLRSNYGYCKVQRKNVPVASNELTIPSHGRRTDAISKRRLMADSVEKLRFRSCPKNFEAIEASLPLGRGGPYDLLLRATKRVLTIAPTIRSAHSQLQRAPARDRGHRNLEFFNRIGR